MNLEHFYKFKCFGEERLYTCIKSKVLKCSPAAGVSKINGKHLKNKTNKDVDGFWIISIPIRSIARNLFKPFSTLSALVIEDCELEQVLRNDLVGLESLKYFYLHGNKKLASLAEDLFESFSKLKEISIINNKSLTGISSMLFKPVLNIGIKYLDLSNNGSVDAFFCPGFDGSLNSIEELMVKIDSKADVDAIDSRDRSSIAVPDRMALKIRDYLESCIVEKNALADVEEPLQEDQGDQIEINLQDPQADLNFDLELQELNEDASLKVQTKSAESLCTSNETLSADEVDWKPWTPALIKSNLHIIIGSRKYPVHKSVLASQSAPLQKSLTFINVLKLNSFTPEIVESFIRFLYTSRMDEKDATKLFVMATCFKVGDLKSMCEKLIIKNITTATAPHIMSLGHRFNNLAFKKVAFSEMKKICPGINLPDEMIEKPERLKEIIEAAQTRKRKLIYIEQESKRLKEEVDKEFLEKLQSHDKIAVLDQ